MNEALESKWKILCTYIEVIKPWLASHMQLFCVQVAACEKIYKSKRLLLDRNKRFKNNLKHKQAIL